jgi:hypothetical protein
LYCVKLWDTVVVRHARLLHTAYDNEELSVTMARFRVMGTAKDWASSSAAALGVAADSTLITNNQLGWRAFNICAIMNLLKQAELLRP